ncbi:hypothetical protein ACVFVO_14590 [Advenella kashmirensis]
MFIDSSNFPLVWMRLEAAPNESPAAAFDGFAQLLTRKQAFVFLSEDGFDEGHEHSKEERKQTALWMKKNKAQIRAYVKGMVLIEPNAAKRLAAKAFAVMFGKFWGYPLLIVGSKDEALEIAHRLLSDKRKTVGG